jgi:hypothetical protein
MEVKNVIGVNFWYYLAQFCYLGGKVHTIQVKLLEIR